MSACVSGCTIRDQHLADCDGTALGRGGELMECRGCLPRPAEVGVLCERCWGRLQSLVRTMPSTVEHLLEVAGQVLASRPGGGGGRRAPGSRCLVPEASVMADELHSVLAAWCKEVAQENLAGRRLPVDSTRWTDGLVAVDPGTWAAVLDGAEEAEPIGLSRPDGTRLLVAWIDPYLRGVAGSAWAGDMIADMQRVTSHATSRFPVEEQERRITDVRCPSCGARSLVHMPPAVVGADVQVRCTLPECGLVMTEEDWGKARAWALRIAQDEVERGEVPA